MSPPKNYPMFNKNQKRSRSETGSDKDSENDEASMMDVLKAIKRDTSGIEKNKEEIQKIRQDLEVKFGNMDEKINNVSSKVDHVDEELKILRNEVEQNKLLNYMDITGVEKSLAETHDNNLKAFVIKILIDHNINGESSSITRVYKRLIKGGSAVVIVAIFKSFEDKLAVMKKKRESKTKSNIYFDHSMTVETRKLFMTAKRTSKDIGGKIFMISGKIFAINQFYTNPNEVANDKGNIEKDLNFFHLNVRGISNINKFLEIYLLIKSLEIKFDVIIFSEVKLKKSFPIQLYNIPGYLRYAKLRSEEGGGGVIVFISDNFVVTHIEQTNIGFEKLKLAICMDKKKINILAYYRPPINSNIKNFLNDIEEEVSSISANTIIVGDININSYSLSVREFNNDLISRQYNELLTSYNFRIINNLPTRMMSGKTIDHFITNLHSHEITSITLEIDPLISDHCALISTIKFPHMKARKSSVIERSIIDYDKLAENFHDINVDCENCNDSNKITEIIINEVKAATFLSTKTLKFKVKNSDKINEWASTQLMATIIKKNKLLTKRRKNPNNQMIQEELQKVSQKLKILSASDFANFIRQKVNVSDSRKLWRNLNVILGRSKQDYVEEIEDELGTKFKNKKEIAEKFNNYFTTCADKLINSFKEVDQPQQVERHVGKSIVFIPPNSKEIEIIINQLKSNSAAGYDEITPKIFPGVIDIGNKEKITRTSSIKYLGIHLNEFLKWSEHIKSLENKVASSNGILWKLRFMLPIHIKKLIYDTLIQSHLAFMIQVWGFTMYREISNLQILQNKALTNTYNLPNRTNRVQMYTHQVESHLPLRGIAILSTACYIYKSIKGHTLSNIIYEKSGENKSNMTLRNELSLRPTKKKTEYGAKAFENIGPTIYNKIPLEIKQSKHQHAFKWCTRCFLRNETFISSCFDASFFTFHLK
ncbi:CLUMA_CG011805, isoform A [Clunio marinus]|uniref:CLUMA_CG011805, isoform A n=1 Tax=Clunio marinus TaxID=568069 RepID=A0A1J1IE11_9DIPT|nr:CLUMA_CG011805, isoform A [Clunio marinus]